PRDASIPEVVGEVNGKPITWDELFAKAAPELIEAEMKLYEARGDALEGLITQQLIEAEAAKTGATPEAFVRSEVESKAAPVTDADVSAFYEENRGRMQGPLEQMKPQIAQYLEQQRGTEVLRALVARLKTENGVKKFLPKYRLEVPASDAPRKGAATAPVQIVEFSDFQCPYCSQAAATVRQVEEKYGDKVSVQYRHFPLPMHGSAHRAAEASMCANDQGQFWKYHDGLFASQKAWNDDDFKGVAKDAGLDVKAFGTCLDGGAHKATVDADMEVGKKVGMSGTPGFYVNGIVLSGARPLEDFVEVIDAELAKAGG
ncbi:MAG: thioredoxin domain-containing protein, partial [Myxococcota bacterium]